jgi:hypothetical protein
MKRLLLAVALVATITFASCGAEKDEDKRRKDDLDAKVAQEEKARNESQSDKKALLPFSNENLQGTWLIQQASGYSRDVLLHTTFVFDGDSATYTNDRGDHQRLTSSFSIEGGKLSISHKHDNGDLGVTTITTHYDGGFYGDTLMLQNIEMVLKLVRK